MPHGGEASRRAADGEIMLAAGAIGTPHLLELSGVGRPDVARRTSAARSSMHCPASARTCRTICKCAPFSQYRARARSTSISSPTSSARWMGLEYALTRRGPMTMAPSQLGMFAKILAGLRDRQCRISRPAAVARAVRRTAAPISRRSPSASATCVRPAAAASMLQSADPAPRAGDPPNYLSTERGPPRRRRFDPPRPPDSPRRRRWRASRREEFGRESRRRARRSLSQAAGDIGTTIFHPVGTAKMGARRRSRRGGRRAAARARACGLCASPTPR